MSKVVIKVKYKISTQEVEVDKNWSFEETKDFLCKQFGIDQKLHPDFSIRLLGGGVFKDNKALLPGDIVAI